jgi:hypothetical protein
VCYAMCVENILTFDQYYSHPLFQGRKDNIYHRSCDGTYTQDPNDHHTEKDKRHDTKSVNVLVGREYWYFGKRAKVLPKKWGPKKLDLASKIPKRGPAHKSRFDQDIVKSFIAWIKKRSKTGELGNSLSGTKCRQ